MIGVLFTQKRLAQCEGMAFHQTPDKTPKGSFACFRLINRNDP